MTEYLVDNPDAGPSQWMAERFNSGGARSSVTHIWPARDLRPHLASPDCWCKPIEDTDIMQNLFVHNSADGREAYEMNMRKKN